MIYTCLDCGKKYECETAPEKCEKCGSPSTHFTAETEAAAGEDASEGSMQPNRTASDENAVRLGANIVFAVFIFIGLIMIIVGIILPAEGGLGSEFGIIFLPIGLLVLLCGWITRASIRLFANMSDRLNSIDKKIN